MNTPSAWSQLLSNARVPVDRGYTPGEIGAIEDRFGFEFASSHRQFLQTVAPIGPRWVNWRDTSDVELRAKLDWPAKGLLFDVESNSFWPRSWGRRPLSTSEALQTAHGQIARLPRLVPIYGHRYLPAAPTADPAPVFSVYQSDVIYYGNNLSDYLAREFDPNDRAGAEPPQLPHHVAFWSDLALGADPVDL